MNSELLSIIIPTFNRALLLRETLVSIQKQSYTNWECIIVDDGSTDATAEVVVGFVKNDERFQYYKRPDTLPKGANACRNFGFIRSKGAYINWFDSDDFMDEEHYKLKIDALIKNPEAHCAIAQLTFFEEKNGEQLFSEAKPIQSKNPVTDYILGKISIGTTNPVWRRSVIEVQESLFDPKIVQSQDLEFYSRIFKEYNRIAIVNQPLIMVRKTAGNISDKLLSGDKKSLRSYLTVRKRILDLEYGNAVAKGVVKQLLYIFRLSLSKKDYVICRECLSVIRKHYKNPSLKDRLKLMRIKITYQLIKTMGFGETRLRFLLRF